MLWIGPTTRFHLVVGGLRRVRAEDHVRVTAMAILLLTIVGQSSNQVDIVSLAVAYMGSLFSPSFITMVVVVHAPFLAKPCVFNSCDLSLLIVVGEKPIAWCPHVAAGLTAVWYMPLALGVALTRAWSFLALTSPFHSLALATDVS